MLSAPIRYTAKTALVVIWAALDIPLPLPLPLAVRAGMVVPSARNL
ncbi:hypothetical protein SAMN05877838_1788 [Hoeflea halophila]|uniref:Uncharacterized protein n=1 Tax=Hoeflea halophila TaxID=714899 RepID=A0A286I9V1_9HYPH|nr:hypothetical protein SAMN05877838_1788 [Hoeflea halophila]